MTSLPSFIFRLIIIAGAVLLLLSCIYVIVLDIEITFFDLLALVLPYLVIMNFVLGFICALKRSKLLFFPLISLVTWFLILGPFFVYSSENTLKPDHNISVLTYNIHGANANYRGRYAEQDSMVMDFIKVQNADLICLQEFAYSKQVKENLEAYPYDFRFYFKGLKRYSPLAIYSKFPILSSASLDFPNTSNNAIYADLLIHGDTLRVYNVHLQSLQFRVGSLKRENPFRLFKRLGNTIRQQRTQVARILEHTLNSPYPYIICGDLNNTQYSTVYRRLKKGMKDTYLERGNGMGTTLLLKFLPFRIDYILVDPQFEVVEHENFDVEYSDHYPVKASFRFRGR